jgi:hypothetical protein
MLLLDELLLVEDEGTVLVYTGHLLLEALLDDGQVEGHFCFLEDVATDSAYKFPIMPAHRL